MARKPKRDMTMEQQLAAGPVDLPFLMLTLMLVGIGLIMVFSASYATAYYDSSASVQNNPLYYIKRQSVYAVIGLVAMYGMSKMNYQHWRLLTIPMLAVSIFLLVLVLTPFGVRSNGAQRWLHIFLLFGPTWPSSSSSRPDYPSGPPRRKSGSPTGHFGAVWATWAPGWALWSWCPMAQCWALWCCWW